MKLVAAATEEQKLELAPQAGHLKMTISWLEDIREAEPADIVIDLLFDLNPEERIELLKQWPATIIVINDVCGYVENLPANFIKINGWPTFLSRPLIEAYCENKELIPIAENLFSFFDKKVEWLPSSPGFVAARIISMIINEAYFAKMEKVSSKEDIDIAMIMGTNYPYGPFEWGRKIGIKKIYSLLKKLEANNPAYRPCDLLTKEATA